MINKLFCNNSYIIDTTACRHPFSKLYSIPWLKDEEFYFIQNIAADINMQLGHKWINISIDFLSPQRVIDWNQRHIITRDSWVKPGDTVCFITEQAISIISRTQRKTAIHNPQQQFAKTKWVEACLVFV